MSLEDDNTSNLPKLTSISSNQPAQKAIQNSTITTVDISVNVSLKTLTDKEAAMSSNIDKYNTFCDQLKNLSSILKLIVNIEQTLRGSSPTFCHEQPLVVKTRQKETRKKHNHDDSSSEDSDDSDDNDTPTLKSPRVNSHHSCVKSSIVPAHREDDKVSIPDKEKMYKNLKVLQWESNNNNIGKDGIHDGEDDFEELAQEVNKEKGLVEPVQLTLAKILETVWQNPQSFEKMKDKMNIYARPENCSSLVVKKCNKKFDKPI